MGTWGNKGAPKDSGVERDDYGLAHAVTYETTTMEQDGLKSRGIFPKPEEIKKIYADDPYGVHIDAKPVTETDFDKGDDGYTPPDGGGGTNPPAPDAPTLGNIAPKTAAVGA